jgi:hypothetical protein
MNIQPSQEQMSLSTSMSTSTNNKNKKRVQFLPYVRVRETPNRDCYTPTDRQNCWFSRREMYETRMEEEAVSSRSSSSSSSSIEQPQQQYTNICNTQNNIASTNKEEESVKVHRHLFACTRSAFDVDNESRQRKVSTIRSLIVRAGIVKCHEEHIADIYRECSMSARQVARAAGVEDERDALAILFESIRADTDAAADANHTEEEQETKIHPRTIVGQSESPLPKRTKKTSDRNNIL